MPEDEEEPAPAVRAEQSTVMGEQTTIVQNEEEAFALEPLDITHIGQCYLMLAYLICFTPERSPESKATFNTLELVPLKTKTTINSPRRASPSF